MHDHKKFWSLSLVGSTIPIQLQGHVAQRGENTKVYGVLVTFCLLDMLLDLLKLNLMPHVAGTTLLKFVSRTERLVPET